jgi:hypothetical protein
MMDVKGASIKLKRATQVIEAKWYGYSNQSGKVIELNTQWVIHNFDKCFLSQIKNLSKNTTAAFVRSVPPGDDREHYEAAYRTMATGPRIKYIQVKNQDTCMVCAMASAVHYAGSPQLASELRSMDVKFEFKSGAFVGFIRSLERKHKAFNAKKENAATLDLLAVKQEILYLACIRGNDGKEDHCIAVYVIRYLIRTFPRH